MLRLCSITPSLINVLFDSNSAVHLHSLLHLAKSPILLGAGSEFPPHLENLPCPASRAPRLAAPGQKQNQLGHHGINVQPFY